MPDRPNTSSSTSSEEPLNAEPVPNWDDRSPLFSIRLCVNNMSSFPSLEADVKSMFYPKAPYPSMIEVQRWQHGPMFGVVLTWDGAQFNNEPLKARVVWNLAVRHMGDFDIVEINYEFPDSQTPCPSGWEPIEQAIFLTQWAC
ncbi:DASH complex, subunit Dad1 [Metarhizium brunneum]